MLISANSNFDVKSGLRVGERLLCVFGGGGGGGGGRGGRGRGGGGGRGCELNSLC